MSIEYEIRELHRDSIIRTFEEDPTPKTADRVIHDLAPTFGIEFRQIYWPENHIFRTLVDLSLQDLVNDGVLAVLEPLTHASPNQGILPRFSLVD